MKRIEYKVKETEVVTEDYPIEDLVSEIVSECDEYTKIEDILDRDYIEDEYNITFRDDEEWDHLATLLEKEYSKIRNTYKTRWYEEFSNKREIITLLEDLIRDSYQYDYLDAETLLQIILTNGNK